MPGAIRCSSASTVIGCIRLPMSRRYAKPYLRSSPGSDIAFPPLSTTTPRISRPTWPMPGFRWRPKSRADATIMSRATPPAPSCASNSVTHWRAATSRRISLKRPRKPISLLSNSEVGLSAMKEGDRADDFLAGGGEMGALTRAFDWSKTGIGTPDTWPQSLRVTVRLVLTSGHPMFIWWGPELIQFYNDAYRATMGPERHPSALGARGRECWEEIWDIIGPQIDYVLAGNGATWNEDSLVPVTRHGRREDVWWTYSFGPIDLDDKVGGVLVVCKDVTSEHMAREALNLINEELKHRVKNTLTVLGAVATQTFRDASSKADLEKYQGRLAAFARAHDLLTAANWAAAPLQDVISTALIPYRTGEGRFTA